jgi:hypothetical protein
MTTATNQVRGPSALQRGFILNGSLGFAEQIGHR